MQNMPYMTQNFEEENNDDFNCKLSPIQFYVSESDIYQYCHVLPVKIHHY